MKKKFLIAFVFVFSTILCAYSQQYEVPPSSFSFVSGYGWSGAVYCGNTNPLSVFPLVNVHNKRCSDCIENNVRGYQLFSGKLSNRQSRLVNYALEQFQLEVGDIYSVGFYEISDTNHYYGITVEITEVNSDGSYLYDWMGFSYYNK